MAAVRPPEAGGARERAVLVTGAASGIGRALARRFARDGARVGLLDRDAASLASLAAEMRAGGTAVETAVADVADWPATRDAVAGLCERLGGLDVLVANAGLTHLSRFEETDPAVLRRVMDVNFFGAVHATRAAFDALRARRGLVVVISSVAGFAPLAGRAGYAASKHALHGLFDSLRTEWRGTGVDVMLVCPGFVDTAIGAHALGGDGGPARATRTTTGRPASPESVADAIVRAAARRRRLLVLSREGRIARALVRLAPGVYDRLMARRLLREPPPGPPLPGAH